MNRYGRVLAGVAGSLVGAMAGLAVAEPLPPTRKIEEVVAKIATFHRKVCPA